MSERTSSYRPDSKFAYPYAYSVAGNPSLAPLNNLDYLSDIPTNLRFSSLDSLVKWGQSAPGSWQSQQTARYSNFHRDLPTTLIPPTYQGQEDEFRLNMLKFMSLGMEELSYESARSDFHPLGHMANVACYLDEVVLRRTLDLYRLKPEDTRMIDIDRHTAVLHDIGEIEHPGAVVNHGKVVGDISSATGKTSEEKQNERAIFVDVLTDVFGEDYDPEFIDSMTRLVCHDLEGADKSFIAHHDRLEIAHHLNSASTAMYIGHLACKLPDEYGNFLSVLAGQGVGILTKKFEEISERSPEVSASLQDDVDWYMQKVKSEAHSRDENPNWLKWRASDKVTKEYGEYRPWTF